MNLAEKPLTILILCYRLMAVLAFCGCSKTNSFTDLEKFEKYIKSADSPYLQTLTKNGIKVSLRYLPPEAMVISEYRNYLETREKLHRDSSLSLEQKSSLLNQAQKELFERKKSYMHSLYFRLTIGYEDNAKDLVYEKMKNGFAAYSEWLQKLLFSLQEYVSLQLANDDEVPLDTYHMERTYGLQKSQTFLLMFPARFNEQEVLAVGQKWLKLRIKEFGLKTGPLAFKFDLPFEAVQFHIE